MSETDPIVQPPPVVILLVEDNPADQRLTERAFKKAEIDCDFHCVSDGEEALDYLHNRGDFVESPRPDLMLLDLNMPRLGGLEVLMHIKQYEDLASIPVIVLTTSTHEKDMIESYKLGCASFVQKPVKMEDFIEAVKLLGQYWLNIVRLPKPKTVQPLNS